MRPKPSFPDTLIYSKIRTMTQRVVPLFAVGYVSAGMAACADLDVGSLQQGKGRGDARVIVPHRDVTEYEPEQDAGNADRKMIGAKNDGGFLDATILDSGYDAGRRFDAASDAGRTDGGRVELRDASYDAGILPTIDAGHDAGEGGTRDAGSLDATVRDAGPSCTPDPHLTCHGNEVYEQDGCGNVTFITACTTRQYCNEGSCVEIPNCNPAIDCPATDPGCLVYDDFTGVELDRTCRWGSSEQDAPLLNSREGVLELRTTRDEPTTLRTNHTFSCEDNPYLEFRWRGSREVMNQEYSIGPIRAAFTPSGVTIYCPDPEGGFAVISPAFWNITRIEFQADAIYLFNNGELIGRDPVGSRGICRFTNEELYISCTDPEGRSGSCTLDYILLSCR